VIGDGDCGEIGGMNIGRGNLSTRRKPAPAPLCPPQISHFYILIYEKDYIMDENYYLLGN
jgi:hypothetical protein